MKEQAPRFEVQPDVSSHFAWMRTQMALENTLLAAVRTSVSLIGFGFTVAQFFDKLFKKPAEGLRELGPEAARNLGLTLIAAGVLSLAVFTYQYFRASRYMRSDPYQSIAGIGERPMHSASYLVSFVVLFIGVAAFIAVLARL